MLASLPADMVNQKLADLGIPNRFSLTSSRSRQDHCGVWEVGCGWSGRAAQHRHGDRQLVSV